MKPVEDEHFGYKENIEISLSKYCLLLGNNCNIKQITLHVANIKSFYIKTLFMNVINHRKTSENSDPG